MSCAYSAWTANNVLRCSSGELILKCSKIITDNGDCGEKCVVFTLTKLILLGYFMLVIKRNRNWNINAMFIDLFD